MSSTDKNPNVTKNPDLLWPGHLLSVATWVQRPTQAKCALECGKDVLCEMEKQSCFCSILGSNGAVLSGGDKRMDPSAEVPPEIFAEILCFVPYENVAANCSRVNRRWNEACNSPFVWREFLYYKHIASVSSENQIDFPPREEKDNLISKMEAEDNGLVQSAQQYADKALFQRFDPWKKYFIWKVSYEHFRWMEEDTSDNYHLSISEDRKVATLGQDKALHANSWGDVPGGYSKGTR